MLLIPAIHLKDGQCMRLGQGGNLNLNDVSLFSDDPVAVASRWVAEGARRLHIVDLDSLTQGEAVNAGVIQEIAEACGDIPIQVSGGIHDETTVESYIQSGARYVVIGTDMVKEPHLISDLCAEFRTHIIIGLDGMDGKVATDGWSKLSKHDAVDMAQHFEDDGAEAIIYTDLSRDGSTQGVNIPVTVKLAEAVNIPVIAAGGILNIDNIRKLAAEAGSGIIGAITSRAIYDGSLNLADGQKLLDEISGHTVFGV